MIPCWPTVFMLILADKGNLLRPGSCFAMTVFHITCDYQTKFDVFLDCLFPSHCTGSLSSLSKWNAAADTNALHQGRINIKRLALPLQTSNVKLQQHLRWHPMQPGCSILQLPSASTFDTVPMLNRKYNTYLPWINELDSILFIIYLETF